jgi:hypothetical protein
MRPADTTPEAWEVQQAIWRRMGGARRVETALRMSDDARALTMAGIRSRHPEYDDEQVRHAAYRLVLGDALYCAAWPDRPLLAP